MDKETKQPDRATSTEYSIEIDCAPGAVRPNDLLPVALEGTEMKVEDFKLEGTSFGNWTYVPFADRDEAYRASKEKIKKNLTRLYDEGRVRYASW